MPPLVYQFLIAFGVAGTAAALVAAALWRLAAFRQWIRPLRSIGREASKIAQADWQGRLSGGGTREIERFVSQFNQLADQTQRRLAELRHQQADLHALVDTLPDPILASDKSGRLILMNAPAGQLFRLSSDQALGQKVVGIISDEQVVELFEAVAAAVATGAETGPAASPHPIQREIRLSRGGQKLTCQAVAARTAGGGALVVLRDVSALARAMQMKTDFVANASHELRTPITAIKIAFETLREALGEDPDQASKCLTVIDGNLHRLEEMLRDLLDLSRVEGPDHEAAAMTVNSDDLFNTLRATMLPVSQQRQVELTFNEPETPQFVSDARLLNLVLKNLVENSIKYTPPGGKVTVTLSVTPGSEAVAAAVMLVVADTGIGIAPEHIDRVFERFYQVDASRSGSAGRGTGLGLAIVKHAVSALGGTVKLESAVGVGTTVTCVFPQPATAVRAVTAEPT